MVEEDAQRPPLVPWPQSLLTQVHASIHNYTLLIRTSLECVGEVSTSMFSVLGLRLRTEHRNLVGQHEFSMLRPWVQVSMPMKNNKI